MKWSKEAEKKISRVPFFVRKRVRKRVEDEAKAINAHQVEVSHVKDTQNKFMNNMEKEVKGYSIETCFGPNGCKNRAVINDELAGQVEALLKSRDILSFLKSKVDGPLKFHHDFRVSLSDCPNSCSRPQIVDIGIIAADRPGLTSELCSSCGSCEKICIEGAVYLTDDENPRNLPTLDLDKCVYCGKCIAVCPTGTLESEKQGYRMLLGGKLGRHPHLGLELDQLFSALEVLEAVDACLDYYMNNCLNGERFGVLLSRLGPEELLKSIEGSGTA